MMDKKSANVFPSKAAEGAGQRKQLPYSVETPYGFHLDLDFLKYVDDIEKGNTIKRVHIQRRARGPKCSTLPRNFSLPGQGPRPPPKDTWSGTSTLGSKPKSRVTEVQQIFDFKPSDGGTSSQSRGHGGGYSSARPKEEARAGVRPFDEQPLGLQARPNLLRTSSMPATVPHRKGSDSGDERPGGSQNGSSESVFRPADVLDRRVPQDRTGLHQQITVALKRVRELEEQVRTIPELKAQICSLREEREKLLLRLQAQTQAQAQAQAASPPLTKTTGLALDIQPRGAAAPQSTSTGGVSEKQPPAEDRRGMAEKHQESPSRSITHADTGRLLAQPSDRQREESTLEATAGTLSADRVVPGAADATGSLMSAQPDGAGASRAQTCSDEDLASVQQLQAKLTALEAKLTLASHDLDRTNVLLREQVEENRLKEERILLLREGAGDEVPPEPGRGRRESVDRETETEKVDLANQETETESAGTVDQGTDMAMIEVCIPQERAGSVGQVVDTEGRNVQDQLMDVDLAGGHVRRHRANSVDRGMETERVDTADQVTETQAPARVDQVTETETNSPGLRPVRRRANSVERGTVTERVDTVDQVTETEGVARADQQTETVADRQDRETNHAGGSVEFGGMVTGTFLTESVVMESVVMESVVMERMVRERVESVFEKKVDNLVTDVALTESSAPEENVVAEMEVREITITEHVVVESVVRENMVVETAVEEQNMVVETAVEEQNMVVETAVEEQNMVVETAVGEQNMVVETAVEEQNMVVETAVGEQNMVVETAVGEQNMVVETAVEEQNMVVETAVGEQNMVVETAVGEQNMVVETAVGENEVGRDVASESAGTASEAPVNVVQESVILESKVVENVNLESVVLVSETTESKVVESETTESKVLESETTESKVLESVTPENKVLESVTPENKVLESETTESKVLESVTPENKVLESVTPENKFIENVSRENEAPVGEATGSSAPKRPPRHIPATGQTQPPLEDPEHSPVQPPAKLKAQPEPPPRSSSEASPSQPPPQSSSEASPSQPPHRRGSGESPTSQPPRRGSGESPTSQPPRRGSGESPTSQPPRRGSGESPTSQPPRRGSGESPTSQPPRRGSGESPTSPAALGQVVTRLTGLLNEQWAQLGSGGQQGPAQQQQDGPSVQKPAAKPTAKATAKPAGKPAGKSGPSKMSSIQNQLVSSLSALSAFYSPGQKAAASKQQGLKSIMKKNEGAGKQGSAGAKKNLKFVGVNGGYESTSSEEEESSGEDKEDKEEEVQEEVDSSDPEEQEPGEEQQEQAQTDQETQGEASHPGAQGEASDPGAQGGGVEAVSQGEPRDAETSQGLQAEQATGVTVDKDFMEACHYIKDHMTAVSSPDKEMRQVLLVLYQEWFRVSSQKESQAHTVTLYLREVGVATPTLLRYIVNLTDGNGNTALHYSVSHGNFPVVKLLLDTGLCEVNIQNKAGYTAVMLACLTAADGSEDMEVALQLLRQGDINTRAGQSGQTALMLAVSHGRIAMVRLLLTCQVDVNIQDRSGSTALMCASEHGHTEISRLLLESGLCHAGLTDKNGQTASSVAAQASHGEIVDLLRAHSAARASDPPATTAPL
ncbi:KN motif and ankyrin repeat domain-containing protein 1 [Osmerus mordax]|uniref:KN motif and ankyrin repeat domain-containing protein 1 n=1 Tax=Osmerus mordax TaxID=8014 RepID=UPI0035100155